MAILFRPPTLMPRSSATCDAMSSIFIQNELWCVTRCGTHLLEGLRGCSSHPTAAPDRLALFQEGPHSLSRVGQLAGRGHDLDRVGVGLGLVQVALGVQCLLADA